MAEKIDGELRNHTTLYKVDRILDLTQRKKTFYLKDREFVFITLCEFFRNGYIRSTEVCLTNSEILEYFSS